MPELELTVGDGECALGLLPELVALYVAVHAEPGFAGPLYDKGAFLTRTSNQLLRPGFTLVFACDRDGALTGFSFGVPLGAGGWWTGGATPPPAEILSSEKFAVIELIVRQDCRGQGIGRALLDRLLAGRDEPFAILTTRPDTPARAMYARWGWEQVGTARHTPKSSTMDQLLLRLPAGSRPRETCG